MVTISYGNNKLSNVQRDQLDAEFTIEELTTALNSLPSNKTPGLDGLSVELYKKFWHKLAPLYIHAIQFCIGEGRLNPSARTGLLQLIPKKERDPLLLTNWRSLTLLNVDYKIFSKALAIRMKTVLPDIIDEDQTGFMAGRDISTNIRKVIDVIQYVKNTDVPCAIMSVDFQKCFDMIESSAIMGALEFFNFGPKFRQYSMLLFASFSAHIQCNGFLSRKIPITRSCHQGCPVSPYYFLCCAQIFHQLIKSHPQIKGIKVHDLEMLLSQFADDTDLFLSFDRDTFRGVESIFHTIYQNMGLCVNYDKTTVYRIGSISNSNAKIYTTKPLAWTNEPINVLGVRVGNNINALFALNFDNIICKTETILNMWIHRNATLSGKVSIINTLVASLFVYKLRVLPNLPDQFIQTFEKMLSKFLWSGRRAKIALQALQLPRECGGLKLVNLSQRNQAFKIQWIQYIRKYAFFDRIFYSQLRTPIKEFIWHCNFKPEHTKHIYNLEGDTFWFQVLYAWAKYNFRLPEDVDEILKQRIWYNSSLLIDN